MVPAATGKSARSLFSARSHLGIRLQRLVGGLQHVELALALRQAPRHAVHILLRAPAGARWGMGEVAFRRRHGTPLCGSWYLGTRNAQQHPNRGGRPHLLRGGGGGAGEHGVPGAGCPSPRRVLQLHPARRRTAEMAGSWRLLSLVSAVGSSARRADMMYTLLHCPHCHCAAATRDLKTYWKTETVFRATGAHDIGRCTRMVPICRLTPPPARGVNLQQVGLIHPRDAPKWHLE